MTFHAYCWKPAFDCPDIRPMTIFRLSGAADDPDDPADPVCLRGDAVAHAVVVWASTASAPADRPCQEPAPLTNQGITGVSLTAPHNDLKPWDEILISQHKMTNEQSRDATLVSLKGLLHLILWSPLLIKIALKIFALI